MPVVATVGGCQIVFYANEHPPPHFHVRSGEHQAVIDIETLTVMAGFLPVASRRKVLAWAEPRREQLARAFARAVAHERVERIQ